MSNLRLAAVIAASLAALPAVAQQQFPATLAGHAFLPATTFMPAPADAPAFLHSSGKFTGAPAQRVSGIGALEGTSFLSAAKAPRGTGHYLPAAGQPVQGFSGIKTMAGGEYLVLTDNGFGGKANSPDAMLMFHRVKPDWTTGRVLLQETLFLHDPDHKVPFVIVTEATATRYLTGSDFDIESIQPIGDAIYFGDEFGPYIIKTDLKGKVLSVHGTMVDGKPARSPDHPAMSMPAVPGAVKFEVRRSRGFEGMAASKDGKTLYPLIEGPVWDAAANAWEMKNGREYLRILEFDVARGEYTGKSWKYLLEINGNNIGDFNMIDASTGLIIERDNGEGDAAQACAGEPKSDCFNIAAKFKRVYKIDLAQADAEGFVKKVGYIDLMDIADPDGKAKIGGKGGKLTFPFVTIEDVDVVDADHIIVANDNNYPYSMGRALGQQDHNEFVLLKVGDFLRAK
jgi:hypothetical protein